jgi:hypothetical protein
MFHKDAAGSKYKLNIQISDRFCMRLDKFAAGIYRVTHQHVKRTVRLGCILYRDEEQGPVFGIHGRLP